MPRVRSRSPVGDDRLFLSRGYGHGASLLQIEAGGGDQATIKPLWKPEIRRVMKTKFGNILVRDGYVYGISGVNLSCIELDTGRKRWEERRRPAFGHGQILLVGDTIVVISEIGELVLVRCDPEEYQELGALQALSEEAATWNSPAFSAPYLLVRNAEEAVCYRLKLADDITKTALSPGVTSP